MVEPQTPEREVGVRYLPPPCCLLERRHIYSQEVHVIPVVQEVVALSRHD